MTEEPSVAAVEFARGLSFDAVERLADAIADEADLIGEASRRGDAREAALCLRRIIAMTKTVCILVGELG